MNPTDLPPKRRSGANTYPNLVPIAATGGGGCFAYDYGASVTAPPIVFINPDEDPGEGRGLAPVAATFSALVGMLRNDL